MDLNPSPFSCKPPMRVNLHIQVEVCGYDKRVQLIVGIIKVKTLVVHCLLRPRKSNLSFYS